MRYDVIVIGAGAAGLMASATAGKQGRSVLLIEHTDRIGEKIRISGGGRCNFTNLNASPKNYISANPHFMISALSRYTQHDFIDLVKSYKISYYEKTLGQLFCDGSSKQIINMLLAECEKTDVKIMTNCTVSNVSKDTGFIVDTSLGIFDSESLIIATGGLSIPKIGATNFGYNIAKKFGIKIVKTKPALVPLVASRDEIEFCKSLSGISIYSNVTHKNAEFRENILFTHKGLSGPAILQISSYIENHSNAVIGMDLLPDLRLEDIFANTDNKKMLMSNFLKDYLPNRFVDIWCEIHDKSQRVIDYNQKELSNIAQSLHAFQLSVAGTEGYLKAEVTVGGVDTNELSSKTMECKKVPGLFFIGEVVDVTGWLGGYNFQWAWSSGFAAGSYA